MTIDPDEYARRFQDRDFARRSPGRRAARFVVLTLAWMAAIGSGALGARWVDDNGGVEAAFRKLMPRPTRAGDAPAQVADAPRKAELPYDGAPPAATPPPLRSAQAIATPGAPAPRPAAKSGQHKATQEAAAPEPDAQAAAMNEKPVDASSGASEAKPEPAAAPDAQPEPAPSPPAPKAAKPVEKMAEKATEKAATEPPPAKTTRKKSSSTTQKIARGREINRIQQQAAEELKKKTRKRRARIEQAKKASKSSLYALPQQRHIRQVLARCEKLDGVFWQEQCKWRICDGRWGKNGCPSYTRDKVAAD